VQDGAPPLQALDRAFAVLDLFGAERPEWGTSEVARAAGLPVPEGRVVPKAQLTAGDPVPRPFVVKPPNEGSSVGVRIVRPNDNSWSVEAGQWAYEEALVERFSLST